MIDKTQYRKFYKNIRNSIQHDVVLNKSRLICNELKMIEEVKHSNAIFVYLSYGKEVKTDEIIQYLLSKGKKVLVPKCNIDTETMIPVEITDFSQLEIGSYKIREPIVSNEYFGRIDLAIIPGISFDRFGNRLGHGKGYYDKFLEDTNICKIGLCYSDCLSDKKIPCQDTDIPMDYVITDREVLKLWFFIPTVNFAKLKFCEMREGEIC